MEKGELRINFMPLQDMLLKTWGKGTLIKQKSLFFPQKLVHNIFNKSIYLTLIKYDIDIID